MKGGGDEAGKMGRDAGGRCCRAPTTGLAQLLALALNHFPPASFTLDRSIASNFSASHLCGPFFSSSNLFSSYPSTSEELSVRFFFVAISLGVFQPSWPRCCRLVEDSTSPQDPSHPPNRHQLSRPSSVHLPMGPQRLGRGCRLLNDEARFSPFWLLLRLSHPGVPPRRVTGPAN